MNQHTVTAVIIDDEPEATKLLGLYLRQIPKVDVIGVETNALRGLDLVTETLPELIFLDIDMPEMNGLQLASQIRAENFYSEIVFTTAFQHYAYDALDVEPLDFLTKPFSIEDVEEVIRKYRTKVEKKKLEIKLDNFIHSQASSPSIKFPSISGVLVVRLCDIVKLKAKSNNCDIYFIDGTMETITRNLYIVIRILNSPAFFQVTRSNCININFLQRVDKKRLKCILCYNQTEDEVEISRINLSYLEKLNLFTAL